MRFQATLEGAECLRRSDAPWMAQCSRCAVQRRRTRGYQSSYDIEDGMRSADFDAVVPFIVIIIIIIIIINELIMVA